MGVKVSKDIDSMFFPSFLLLHSLSCWPRHPLDPQVHLTFLTSLLSRIDTAKSQEAHVLLLATIAHAKLLYGDVEGTKTDMDEAWKILDSLEGVENAVNAAYYGVAADYYKVCLSLPPPPPPLLWEGEANVDEWRQKRTTRRITNTRFFTLLVWIRRKICRLRKGWGGHMIWVFRLSLGIRFIILENWYVAFLKDWKKVDKKFVLIVDAPHPGCVERYPTWMDQETSVHV